MNIKIKQWIKCFYERVQKFSAKDKKKAAAILCIAAVFMLFLAGFFMGRIVFSKQYTLNSLESALNKKNYYRINKYCRFESEVKVKREEIKPFADYFTSKERVNSLIVSLKGKGRYSEFIELKKKKWFLFTDYYVSIKKVDIKVKVNFADTKIYLNEIEKYKTKEDNETVTIKDITPGIYKLKAVNKNDFDEISFEKEINVVTNNKSYDAELKGVKVSIDTEFPDADVFVNDVKMNDTAGKFVNKGPFSTEKENVVYIEKAFPWGKIQSDKKKVTDDPVIHLKFTLNNENLDTILKNTIDESVKSIFDAMNAEDSNMIKGENKEKIYNEFVVERKLLRNQYELSQYDLRVNDCEVVKKEDTFYANIYTTLKYKVSKDIFRIELHSEVKEKKVFFKTEMDQDMSWKVVDIYVIK